ncbi:MAG TPA: VTT domain-containing protein [Marmoricola sp.]|nr:VTT domain-containing protein [Marmoricola sp.]
MILDVVHLAGASWMDPQWWLDSFGQAFFWVSAAIIFAECGLFFPFLPGDTLLFALGLFISGDKLDVIPGGHGVDLIAALVILSVGAFLGNVVGYEIGRKIGTPLFERDGKILKKKYLTQTHAFFEKYGNAALVIGRFVPFVRTYVTVVAGIGQMDRRRFLTWSGVGAALWVLVVTLLGFFLGSAFPNLATNIDKATIAILAFSVVPVAYEWWKHRRNRAAARRAGPHTQADLDSAVDSDVEV